MFTVTYRRSYHGQPDPTAAPPPALVALAQAQIPYLHPTRVHHLVTGEPCRALERSATGALRTSIGWCVTFTPAG